MHRPVLLVVAFFAAAAVGFLIYSANSDPAPGPGVGPGVGPGAGSAAAEQGTAGGTEVGELPGASRLDRQSVANDPAVADAGESARFRGRVVDSGGVPVQGAEVHLMAVSARGDIGSLFRERPTLQGPVTTGADGVFELDIEGFKARDVAEGANGGEPEMPELPVMVVGRHAAMATTVDNRTATWNAGVAELGDVVLTTGGGVLGSVTDLGGTGVPRASIEIQPQGPQQALRWVGGDELGLVPEITADGSGYFRADRLAPGRYRILAAASGHQRERTEAFEVVDGQETTLDPIQLGPGFAVAGRVIDQQGQAVADARVNLGRYRTRTDDDGNFSIDHIPPGTYSLEVHASGYLQWETADVDPAQRPRWEIVLQPGLMVSGRVTNEGGDPVEAFAVRARRVRNLPGAGDGRNEATEWLARSGLGGDLPPEVAGRLQNLSLRLESVNAQNATRARGTSLNLENFLTGRGGGRNFRGKPEPHPDGVFELDGLSTEGVYVVDVAAEDYLSATSAEFELRLGAGPAIADVVMEAGLRVSGVIVDSAGEPVAGAKVELMPAAPDGAGSDPRVAMFRNFASRAVAEATADRSGRFELGPASPGNYQLRGEADGYSRTEGDVFELATSADDLVLTLDSRGRLVGRVLGIPAGRAGDVRVHAVPISGASRMRFRDGTRVDEDGRFTTEVAPGGYVVRAGLEGDERVLRNEAMSMMTGEQLVADAEVRSGEETAIDVELLVSSVGTVVGTVTVNGEPGVGYMVSAVAADDGTGAAATLNMFRRMAMGRRGRIGADGTFALDDVDSGPRRLEVRSPAGLTVASVPIAVVEGRELRQDVRLFLATLAVEIEGLEGRDLNRSRLRLNRPGEDPSVTVRPGRDNTVEGLTLGSWEYTFTVPGREAVSGTIDVQGEAVELKLEPGPAKG